jgi:hypothetical protein
MLKRVNQLIQLRQDFLHLGGRVQVRERQTQVYHAANIVGAAVAARGLTAPPVCCEIRRLLSKRIRL